MMQASRSPSHFLFPMLPQQSGVHRSSSASRTTALMRDMPDTPTNELNRRSADAQPPPPTHAGALPPAASPPSLSPLPSSSAAALSAASSTSASESLLPLRARVRQWLVLHVLFCFSNKYTRLIVSLVLATVNLILLYFTSFAFYLTHFLVRSAASGEAESSGEQLEGTESCASFSLSLFLVFVFFRALCHLMLIGIRMRDSSMWLNQRLQMAPQHKFFHAMQALLLLLSLVFLSVGFSWLASSAARQCVPLATPLVVGVLSYETLALALPLLAVALLAAIFPLRSLSLFSPYIPLTSEVFVSEKLGLSPADIERLPCCPYAAGMWEEEDRRCSICLGEAEVGEQVRVLACRHHFHRLCIDQWLLKKPTCPLCVSKVEVSKPSGRRSRGGRLGDGVRHTMHRLRAGISRTRREESRSELPVSAREESESSRASPLDDSRSAALEVDEALEMV